MTDDRARAATTSTSTTPLSSKAVLFLTFSIGFGFRSLLPILSGNVSSIATGATLSFHSSLSSASLLSGAIDNFEAGDPDAECPFRRSPIYRSIYVYPMFNGTFGGEWSGPILSDAGRRTDGTLSGGAASLEPWPWVAYDETERERGVGKYDLTNSVMQSYSLELVIRDIIAHPRSCLRTTDPEKAALFYVPYLSSAEYHKEGVRGREDRMCQLNSGTSPHGRAIIDAMDGKYEEWESRFGLTSKYWRRRNGADHILVHSEATRGLNHHSHHRGHYVYVHSQFHTKPPISIFGDVSTTFVRNHPKCTSKNILVPHPNPDGRWYNGEHQDAASGWRFDHDLIDVQKSDAALPSEKEIARTEGGILSGGARPVAHFYAGGNNRGACPKLREALSNDLGCTSSAHVWNSANDLGNGQKIADRWSRYVERIQQATFCPCPVGESPSARRMFDSILAGCIPVILSDEFVWPFTAESDPEGGGGVIDPREFSVRWNVSDFLEPKYDADCKRRDDGGSRRSLQEALEAISSAEIRKLRQGVERASKLYSFYSHSSQGVANLLRERVFPDGGAAHALVDALAERAGGVKWDACRAELNLPSKGIDPDGFGCSLTDQATAKAIPQVPQNKYYNDFCKARENK